MVGSITTSAPKRFASFCRSGFESNAILQYLAAKKPASGLWPIEARGQADVLRWHSWDAADWFPTCAILTFERLVKKLTGQGEPDHAQIAKG